MPKAKVHKDELDKKSLPEVLEQSFEGHEEVAMLLEELAKIQGQIGSKPDDKKGREGSGWLAQAATIKSKLSSIMAVEGLEGLRHNNLVYSDVWVDGRESVDMKALKIELAQEGVDLELLNRCIERCTRRGDGYSRRVLTDLTKPRSGWED